MVVPHAPTWYQRLGARLIWMLIRGVGRTLRYRWTDPSGFLARPSAGPAIFCFWHNRLALCMEAHRLYYRGRPRRGIAALVSASRDGGFLSAILECFGVEPVRGSTSRRGPQALLELTTWADRGYDLAITPDGPRGPRYVVQEGAVSLAQLTGLPVVCFAFHIHWKIRFRSWDGFQVPLPFTRCDLAVAAPILVPQEATDAQREELRRQIEDTLRAFARD